MILTCPECATRYSVADNSVGPEGRTVRCTSCGLTWRAEPEAPLELAPATPEPEAAPAPTGDDLRRAFRERIAVQNQGRRIARSGLVWGGAAAGFLLAVTSVVLGRNDVVAAWPNSASAYAGLGLSVNSVGLVIEGRPAQVGWENGKPTVLVSGKLRNVRNRPVESPPLRFTLLDGSDRVLSERVFQVTNAEIPAGGSRSFTVKLQDPPESVQDVEIGFQLGGSGHGSDGHDQPSHEGSKTPAHGAEPAHAEPPQSAHADTAHALRPAQDHGAEH